MLPGEVSFLIYLTPTEPHSQTAVLCNIQLRGDLRLQHASVLGPNATVGPTCCFQMRHIKCQIMSYLSFKRAMSAGLMTIQGIYRTPEETQNPPLRFLHCVQHPQGQITEKTLSKDRNTEAALLFFFHLADYWHPYWFTIQGEETILLWYPFGKLIHLTKVT